MAISAYLANRLLNLTLRNTTFPEIAALYGALHTDDPGLTGTGNPLASTPRFAVTFGAAASATSFNDAGSTQVGSASGTALYLSLWDGSATATANFLVSGALSSGGSKMNTAGSTWVLASGKLVVNIV